ncbi:helix-turn-helix transcriptional regulator [Rhodoferax ferrireducens]|uniref:helix-turn-helix transcriptional regulator n=1 Tax=Rhodoferax ferrireducens TaxID=192843 RepID=UPI00298DFBD5|nr:helix-turn-helix transcriptional regulator [Rhodoferax ferrireducens]WPC68017.1 helix-turn-helix transcriptional regulator [Rhodoferax ferrireducens]
MKIVEMTARAERARNTCKARGITQEQIAADLGASQSQVSRILSGHGSRASRLAEEVCLYVERAEGGVTAESVRANDELVNALTVTWNGSAAHARALSAVIRSLSALGPIPGAGSTP